MMEQQKDISKVTRYKTAAYVMMIVAAVISMFPIVNLAFGAIFSLVAFIDSGYDSPMLPMALVLVPMLIAFCPLVICIVWLVVSIVQLVHYKYKTVVVSSSCMIAFVMIIVAFAMLSEY